MRGKTLRRLMVKRGISQQQLADALGLKKSNVSVMCNKITNPTEKRLKELAEVLGCTVDELLE